MFLHAVKPRKPAAAVSAPLAAIRPDAAPDETLAYYTRAAATGPLREVTALDQIYGYWIRD